MHSLYAFEIGVKPESKDSVSQKEVLKNFVRISSVVHTMSGMYFFIAIMLQTGVA